jgi:hypothetical protein
MATPYAYDYDLVALALAAALIAPDILARCSTAEACGLVTLGWLGTANHFLATARMSYYDASAEPGVSTGLMPFTVLFLAAAFAWSLVILRRDRPPHLVEAAS